MIRDALVRMNQLCEVLDWERKITLRPEQSKIKSSTASEVSGIWTSLLDTWQSGNKSREKIPPLRPASCCNSLGRRCQRWGIVEPQLFCQRTSRQPQLTLSSARSPSPFSDSVGKRVSLWEVEMNVKAKAGWLDSWVFTTPQSPKPLPWVHFTVATLWIDRLFRDVFNKTQKSSEDSQK